MRRGHKYCWFHLVANLNWWVLPPKYSVPTARLPSWTSYLSFLFQFTTKQPQFGWNVKPLYSFFRPEGTTHWHDTHIFHGYAHFLLSLVIKLCRRGGVCSDRVIRFQIKEISQPAGMDESVVNAWHFALLCINLDHKQPLIEAYLFIYCR